MYHTPCIIRLSGREASCFTLSRHNFVNTGSVRLSIHQDWGGGVYFRNASVTFLLFWHGASLGWHKSHIKRYIWLNLSKCHFSRSVRSNLALFALWVHLLQNGWVTFLYFGIELPRKGTNELPKDGFAWIALNVLFQDPKGQIWPIFTYVSMLFNSTEVLPNCIAPCSCIGVMSMLS